MSHGSWIVDKNKSIALSLLPIAYSASSAVSRRRACLKAATSGTFGAVVKICVLILFLALAGGCAGSKQEAKAPFQDKEVNWEKLAEISKGHSPSPIKKTIDIHDYQQQIEKESSGVKEKPLPSKKVSLKMRNADLKSILRALARATDINLFVKDDIKVMTSVDFEAVPWDEVFNSLLKAYSLTYVWEGDILRVLSNDDLEQQLKAETTRGKLETQELQDMALRPLSTVVVPIDYADTKSLRDDLQEFLTKDKDTKVARGTVRVDQHSNSLIIQASHEDIEKMLPVIEKIDKPTPQILIRANIVETTKDVARNLGIQWGGIMKAGNLWLTPGGGTSSTTGTSSTSSSSTGPANPVTTGTSAVTSGGYSPTSGSTGLSGQGMGVSFPVSSTAINAAGGVGALGLMWGTIGGTILETQLQALQTEGKANIISSPSLTTVDNEKAFTESGTTVPYVTYTLSGGSSTPTVNFVDAVLRLEITPHVIGGKNLKMIIVVKKNDVDTSQTVQGNPFIIKKQTETTLIVENGETIVIAGLTSLNHTHNTNGVPLLQDVPVLGNLFKGDSKEDSSDQVLIFITPYILPRSGDLAEASNDGHATPKE
ncbi:MAG: type IV pilus secretin PilQ [Dissulfurispiraceae bacterium]